jgi:transposase
LLTKADLSDFTLFSGTTKSMSGSKRRYDELQPQLQRDIVADYRCGVRGHGYLAIAKKHQLPVPTVQSVIARAERAGGDPVAPRGHKKRKLDSDEQARLYSSLDRNPFATNQQLRARVGNKIAASTVSRYLARANPPFTAKVAQDQEPEELTENWKEEARKWLRGVKRIALSRRIYEDETPIYANEAPHKGRSRKGKPIIRPRARYATKYTLHVYAKKDRVLHWDLSDKNADTKETERVAVDAATQMDMGDTLIWDRLGRSGRAMHPVHQHYSPAVREEFKARGVSIKFLPPKGKYFNPIELLFNDLKSHHIRPNFPENGQNLSKSKIRALVREYMDERAPTTLSGFFSARANGKYAIANKIL